MVRVDRIGEPAKFSCHTFAQTGSAALTQSEESAEQFFELQTESNKEYWRRLGVAAPDWTGKRVLDVGCGLGALSIEMAQAGPVCWASIWTRTSSHSPTARWRRNFRSCSTA
ncbi:hypothetical protein BZL29_2796 [Mycobacterium kansasii]|uniref:Methyltransferase domain protein n=1 Tax=Mycobacterium kansasii TaxID=1768 RepID=A0A1V3XMR6_MYCKA|nr:hypothetical protein BZL29_2796 [Mycobacterium kansasii]